MQWAGRMGAGKRDSKLTIVVFFCEECMKALLGSMALVGVAAGVVSAYAQASSVAVTVYNSNLGVVKDVRTMDIERGVSQIKVVDVAELIDPTSVHIKFPGVVLEQNYQYDLVSLNKILMKYIDREVQLIGENGEVLKGTLLSVTGDQVVLKKADGGLLMLPSIAKYRLSVESLPDGLITRPTLVWNVNATKGGKHDVEVSYQTQGMNWHAEYVAVLNDDDTKMDLNAWVSVENNSGATYRDAVLKLVAGDVNRVQEGVNIRGGRTEEYMMAKAMVADDGFQEKEFFEYHIYNLQRPTTLANNETKQIALFESAGASVVKKYKYFSGGGPYMRYSGNGQGKVGVVVEFENKESNKLGQPMPKGKVRLYKSDGSSVEFIGEDMVDHTPRDEKVSLRIGDAFDIVAEEVQTNARRISEKVNEATYKITLKNRKQKEDVVVEVERFVGLNWEITQSSREYEKKNAQNIVFKVPVQKGKEATLEFTVRYNN